jgi:hypothetical protein
MFNTVEERELKVESAIRSYAWRLIHSVRKIKAPYLKTNKKLVAMSVKELKELGVDNYKELVAEHLRITALCFPNDPEITNAIAEVLTKLPNNIIKLRK